MQPGLTDGQEALDPLRIGHVVEASQLEEDHLLQLGQGQVFRVEIRVTHESGLHRSLSRFANFRLIGVKGLVKDQGNETQRGRLRLERRGGKSDARGGNAS